MHIYTKIESYSDSVLDGSDKDIHDDPECRRVLRSIISTVLYFIIIFFILPLFYDSFHYYYYFFYTGFLSSLLCTAYRL